MRIGSFFLILLIALVVLGFLLSDSLHLREDMNKQQKEIARLQQTLQSTEQEKQNALTALRNTEQERQNALVTLQNTNQELQTCQQKADQTSQLVTQLTDENTLLIEQNNLLATLANSTTTDDVSNQKPNKIVQSNAFGLIVVVVVGFGSAVMIGLKNLQKHPAQNGHNISSGKYVFMTEAEIKELVQSRRRNAKPNIQN